MPAKSCKCFTSHTNLQQSLGEKQASIFRRGKFGTQPLAEEDSSARIELVERLLNSLAQQRRQLHAGRSNRLRGRGGRKKQQIFEYFQIFVNSQLGICVSKFARTR